jgi:hypothetical protein
MSCVRDTELSEIKYDVWFILQVLFEQICCGIPSIEPCWKKGVKRVAFQTHLRGTSATPARGLGQSCNMKSANQRPIKSDISRLRSLNHFIVMI